MKVYIPGISGGNPKTGKGFFAYRLSLAMKKNGVDVSDDVSASYDIALSIIKNKSHVKTRKNILRLDGAYHDKYMNYKKPNKEIARELRSSDGIVYQSVFSKKICDTFVGVFNGPTSIIHNGADPDWFRVRQPHGCADAEHVFMTASRWRPHKRIVDIMESFLLADIDDSILFVAGDIVGSKVKPSVMKKYFYNPKIKFLGKMDQINLACHLVASKGFIHLCWFDNCPNSVVESICAGLPVVTNNVGGTHEIVRPSGGIVCEIDKPYNFKPCDLYHPPSIDRQIVADAIRYIAYNDMVITNEHVRIDNIARQYITFFEEVLKS